MKNKSGMSIIEVMVALTIMGMVIMLVLNMQGRTARRARTNAMTLERIVAVENFFAQARQSMRDEKPVEKEISSLQLHMKYQRSKVGDRSALAGIENIMLERVEASWTEFGKQKKELYVRAHAQLAKKGSRYRKAALVLLK